MADRQVAGPRVIAIVPVGTLAGAKSRLGGTLDAEERETLARQLARRTIEAVAATPGIAETIVVTPDDEIRGLALEAGARPIRQRSRGLNSGLREARDEAIAAGAEAILVLPVDVPLVSPEAIEAVLAPLVPTASDDGRHPGAIVVLVPDRHGRGTNALALTPPDAIDFGFGGNSREAHRDRARAAGARYVELGGPLSLDLDTPDDLLLVEQLAPEAVDAH